MSNESPSVPSTSTSPGWRTSEFWLSSAATFLGLLFASGLIADGSIWARAAGLAAMILTSMGYSVSRAMVKRAAALLLVVGLAAPQMSCATARARAAAGAGAFLDCEDAGIKSAWTELLGLARPAIMWAISGDGTVDPAKFKAALGGVRDDAGRCAMNAVIAALVSSPPEASFAGPVLNVRSLQEARSRTYVDLGWPRMN